MFKKSTALLFSIFVLVFTPSVSAASLPEATVASKGSKNQKNVISISKDELDKKYKSEDQVRVIVEMKEEPAIEYAEKKGKRYKDLPKNTKKKLKMDKLAEHKRVKAEAKSQNIELNEIESFTTVVNGFSAKLPFGKIDELSAMQEVQAVYIANEYSRPQEEPDMKYSKELVQAQESWRDYGYKGEGMVVGIIDTGIDPSHKDMVLSSGTETSLTKAKVELTAAENSLPGKYYTKKVPYGYNYMDEDNDILDSAEGASMHGMHVAGTVGANGDEDQDGIKGIAPEAQLLALKVFGNDPDMQTTWGDIYIKAIDDAITLGADVLNMSLGSTGGFVDENAPEQAAITRAVDNGILLSISAGNSAHFGNGFDNPKASNPDIGVAGSPGIAYNSLQVASIENNFIDLDAVDYTFDGKTASAPFMSASAADPQKNKEYKIVDAGLGTVEDLAKADVKGKYALIQRGGITFLEKTMNAQAAGAAGAIIYNNADGFVSMATDPAIIIPQLFMLKTDGDKVKAALTAGKDVSITFTGKKMKTANPTAGAMSTFTSWGTADNLDFKPEITAPGGQIYSTLNNNEYGMMSGTSMAAPHVSGGSALVMERVDDEFKLKGYDRVNMAKNLLMNTSKPVIDQGTVNSYFKWNLPYSPRRQGAGLMQLHAALKTPVVVTEKKTNEAKAAMKEVGNKFSFTLKAKNYGKAAAKYKVNGNVQTDFATEGQLGYSADTLEAQKIEGAKLTVDGSTSKTITVPAGKSVEFTVTVDVSKAKVLGDDLEKLVSADSVFPNGYFVEGFVTLTDPADKNPELHIPYNGFKGDWDKAPIIDGMKWDKDSYYGAGGALSPLGDEEMYLGYDEVNETFSSSNIAISPNGDGMQDSMLPILSFLRNAGTVEYSITDSKGKELRKLRTVEDVTKDYYDGGTGTYYKVDPDSSWDGKINNKLKDGTYYYQIKAKLRGKDAAWQTYQIPVQVDTAVPSVKLNKTGEVLSWTGTDQGAGIAYYDILVDGKSVLSKPLSASTKQYTLKDAKGSSFEVKAVDYAGNTASSKAGTSIDTKAPVIHLAGPEALGVSKESQIAFTGTIDEASSVKEMTIDGHRVPVTHNDKSGKYEFSFLNTYKDGVHKVTISATDSEGNKASFKRAFIVDSTAPALNVKGAPKSVKANGKNPKVNVTASDNFDELRISLNGSEIYAHIFKEPFEMRSITHTIKNLELKLEPGENTFVFEVTDIAGNKTVESKTIVKETKKK